MARYSIRKPTRDDIPALRNHQQVTGRNTEIGLVLFNQDEWEHIIDTYEHSILMIDDEKDGYIFGYHLTAQIENNCWVREIFIEKEYRANKDLGRNVKFYGFGSYDNLPFYYVIKKAKELGGMVIAPIASDNERAVSAMLGAYGFRHDRTIDRWYDPKDLAIYIEDTGTKPYQNV
tara:strand:+ start:3500 stop:4024 length:525 start_codon:yes stop_codon:yes gene_type:complete